MALISVTSARPILPTGTTTNKEPIPKNGEVAQQQRLPTTRTYQEPPMQINLHDQQDHDHQKHDQDHGQNISHHVAGDQNG